MSKAVPKLSKKYLSFWLGGYVPQSNHFVLRKFISTNNPSISCGNLCPFSSLDGMPSLTYTRIPPPNLFLFSLWALEPFE